MRRSQTLTAVSILTGIAGIALAAGWLLFAIQSGVGLLRNGPWLIATILLLVSVGFAFASHVTEQREIEEADRVALERFNSLEQEHARVVAILAQMKRDEKLEGSGDVPR